MPRIGVSACLLGHKVRYNGGHSRDSFITDTLGKYVSFVPVCPEVECGFSTPRPALRLVGNPASPRLVITQTGEDQTERMLTWCSGKLRELEAEHLCGFIFKSRSPSSGMSGVKVYTEEGMPGKRGSGLFAKSFMDHFPFMPTEDEGRLNDPKLREGFIEAIFVMKRWQDTLDLRPTRKSFIEFHMRHKFLIMAHSPSHLRLMGKLVAGIKQHTLSEFQDAYQQALTNALRLKTTVKKNADVLFHIMGFFKQLLSSDEKQELIEIFETYLKGHVPLIVPITLLNHYVRKYDQEYLKQQLYLDPHPAELQLRNHA
jgi:uncharacterized protein YbgA (DUF1722 family)/uncharacterized protein YbbK (DUF523 family)